MQEMMKDGLKPGHWFTLTGLRDGMIFLQHGINQMSLRLQAGQVEVELLDATTLPLPPLTGWAISQSKPDSDAAYAAGLLPSGTGLIALADARRPATAWDRLFAHFVAECQQCRNVIHVPIQLYGENQGVNTRTPCNACGQTNNILQFHIDLDTNVTRFVFLSPGPDKWCRTARLSKITETVTMPPDINQTLALLDASKTA